MQNIKKILLNIDLIISGLSLIILIAVTFLGVLMRYIFNSPLIWLQEVQLWSLISIVFFAGGAAFCNGSHVAIDFVVDKLSSKYKIVTEIIVMTITVLLMIYLAVNSLEYLELMAATNRVTDILNIPYSIVYSVFPIGCLLIIIHFTVISVSRIKAFNTTKKEQ